MKLIRLFGPCVALALVLGVTVTAASASAAENSIWTVCEESTGGLGVKWEDSLCSKELVSGKWEIHELTGKAETRPARAKAEGAQKLDVGGALGDKISCTKLNLNKEAVIIGGEPGDATGTLEYEGCTVEEHAECKVNETGKVTTSPLTSELVFATEAAAKSRNPEAAALLSKPTTAGAAFYKEVNLTGKGCPKAGKQEVKGELIYDFVEGGKHREMHELTASTAHIYWVNKGGVAVSHEITPLTSGGESVSFILPLILIIGAAVTLGVWLLS